MYDEIIILKLLPHLPGANELKPSRKQVYNSKY